MEQSQIERYGWIIVLMVMVNVGMVWAQANDTPAADSSGYEEMAAVIPATAAECRPLPRHAYRDEDRTETWGEREPAATSDALREQEGIPEPRPLADGVMDGVMVAEDMRCRQCRGKCAADSLRCRSQCAGDSTCEIHCQERTEKCEALCKQVFQCE